MKKICPKCLNTEKFYIFKDEKKSRIVDAIGNFLMELDETEDVAGNLIKVKWYCDLCDTECMDISDFAEANKHKKFLMTVMMNGTEKTEVGKFLGANGEKINIEFAGASRGISQNDLLRVKRIF